MYNHVEMENGEQCVSEGSKRCNVSLRGEEDEGTETKLKDESHLVRIDGEELRGWERKRRK